MLIPQIPKIAENVKDAKDVHPKKAIVKFSSPKFLKEILKWRTISLV